MKGMINYRHLKSAAKLPQCESDVRVTLKSQGEVHCVSLEIGGQVRDIVFQDIFSANKFAKQMNMYTKLRTLSVEE